MPCISHACQCGKFHFGRTSWTYSKAFKYADHDLFQYLSYFSDPLSFAAVPAAISPTSRKAIAHFNLWRNRQNMAENLREPWADKDDAFAIDFWGRDTRPRILLRPYLYKIEQVAYLTHV